MADEKLDKLVKEEHRTFNNLQECDGSAFETCWHEWQAAKSRLNLYFKEIKEPIRHHAK